MSTRAHDRHEPEPARVSPRATVVVVNYNGAHLLPGCLDALRAQRLPDGSFETVVVDNASTDGSRELLTSRYPWVRLLASDRNLGFAGGNNLALRQVTTPYAVLLNNDAVPEPDWLGSLLAAFDRPGAERLGVVTGKVLFLPRFVSLDWRVDAPPVAGGRGDASARVYRVEVDGVDVTDKVLWERLASAPQGTGGGRFRRTRPSGPLLVPVPGTGGEGTGRGGTGLDVPVTVKFLVAGAEGASLAVTGPNCELVTVLADRPTQVEAKLPAGTPLVDVVNNVGGIVLRDGYGADRGFQEVDSGQYDQPAEVFAACGNGMAVRVAAGREVGWFDEDFFLYYEDTDLSWRLRARGWSIRYEPGAVLRHVHSASSREWSPLWSFYVDRNRLLMLTKNASAGLALRAVLRYPLTSASLLARALLEALRTRRAPALRPHVVRARVLLSYLRLLVPMLRRRLRLGRAAVASRRELGRRLATRR
jgi:GT2 family glycosyltransferase